MHGVIIPSAPKRSESSKKSDWLFGVGNRQAKVLTRQFWDDWKTSMIVIISWATSKGLVPNRRLTSRHRSNPLLPSSILKQKVPHQWTAPEKDLSGS